MGLLLVVGSAVGRLLCQKFLLCGCLLVAELVVLATIRLVVIATIRLVVIATISSPEISGFQSRAKLSGTSLSRKNKPWINFKRPLC